MALLYKGVPSNPENGLRVRLGFNDETLSSGTKVLTPQDPQFQLLEPSGGHRQVNMPLESASQGLFFRIENLASATHKLNIHDSTGAAFSPTIEIPHDSAAFLVCDGSEWTLSR
jgi:hypothetical protein